MLGEVIVGDGYGGGSMDHIDEAIGASSQEAMVDPNIGRSKYINGVSIRATTMADVVGRISHHASLPWLAIMNANPMNNNMANVLYRNARPIGDLHFGSSPIYGLEAVNHQLILQSDNHVPGENDPQWLCLDHTISKCAGFWVNRVVGRAGDDVYGAILASDGGFTEAHGAIRQGTAVGIPMRVFAPARVYNVHDFLAWCIVGACRVNSLQS